MSFVIAIFVIKTFLKKQGKWKGIEKIKDSIQEGRERMVVELI